MDNEQIKLLLQSHRRIDSRHGFRCPDEHRLAAYVDGQLSGSERTAFEKHAAGCEACLDEIAFLTRSGDWTDTKEIPAYLVARARALVNENPTSAWRWAFATAAAACVVLALMVVVWRSRVQQPTVPADALIAQNQATPEEVAPTPKVEPQRPLPTQKVTKPNLNRGETLVRGNESPRGSVRELKPVLLFPREGSVVRKDILDLRWQPVPDAVSYEVRLITADGSLRLVRETPELSLNLGADVALQTDTHYYVRVIAHMRDGRVIQSDIVSFRLAKN